MSFNPRLPCVTSNRRKVEILAVLPPEKASTDTGETIVALVYGWDGEREIVTYRPDGRYDHRGHDSGWDLVNVPVPVVTAAQLAANRKMFVTQTAALFRAAAETRKERV